MKIAVYTIAKNEAKHAERFAESCKDTDEVVVVDTGSTDSTVEILLSLGVKVYEAAIDPWRFDDARNVALALVSKDVDWCITLDLDEVLVPGWREEFERAVQKQPSANCLRYGYVWNWKEDGSPGITFRAQRTHRRRGWRWKDPIHEAVVSVDNTVQYADFEGVMIHHHADNGKPRHNSYLQLLERAVEENPQNERMRLYLFREQLYREWRDLPGGRAVAHHLFGRFACTRGYYVEGLTELTRALQMSTNDTERAAIQKDVDRFKAISGGAYG